MRYISFDIIMQALRETDLDAVYERLHNLFMQEPIYIIDRCGSIVYTPYDEQDLWDYLEGLYQNSIKEVEL